MVNLPGSSRHSVTWHVKLRESSDGRSLKVTEHRKKQQSVKGMPQSDVKDVRDVRRPTASKHRLYRNQVTPETNFLSYAYSKNPGKKEEGEKEKGEERKKEENSRRGRTKRRRGRKPMKRMRKKSRRGRGGRRGRGT